MQIMISRNAEKGERALISIAGFLSNRTTHLFEKLLVIQSVFKFYLTYEGEFSRMSTARVDPSQRVLSAAYRMVLSSGIGLKLKLLDSQLGITRIAETAAANRTRSLEK